jgi:serine/threonine protein kinase
VRPGYRLPYAASSLTPLNHAERCTGWVFYYASAWAAPADTSARYELGKRLGQGAFGTVYCATDRAGCTLVAVKMFDRRRYRTHARFGGDTNLAVEIFVRDFAQEVAMLRLLEHPFLVRMLEQTVIDGNNCQSAHQRTSGRTRS